MAIVIPHFSRTDLLHRCLASVLESRYPCYRVTVVDNGRTFSPADLPDGIKLISPSCNLGYAGGCNEGISSSDAPFVVFLNDDTVVEPDWLDHLVAAALRHPEAGALQPKILSLPAFSQTGRRVFDYAGAAGGMLDPLGYPYCLGRSFLRCQVDRGQYDRPRTIAWASGAALLVRREAFLAAGGFDDSFFMHMEEIDLCWGMRRSGWSIRSVPSAMVWHEGGASLREDSGRKVYLNHRNNLRMLAKNRHGIQLYLTLALRLPLELAASLYYLFQSPTKSLAVIKALVDLAVNRTGAASR